MALGIRSRPNFPVVLISPRITAAAVANTSAMRMTRVMPVPGIHVSDITPHMVTRVPIAITGVMLSPSRIIAVSAAKIGEVAASVDATVAPARSIDSRVK